MIDLFDYILTLFDASYNADTLKRSFKIMLFMHGLKESDRENIVYDISLGDYNFSAYYEKSRFPQ